ncbi:hypothetical protein DFJ74DRAFT_662743 [Hyaloraphidium curvatum]|nr:hypothetical protein DFJ74DRAFT_662743 [Hyaloraphidium curvatum]
MLFDQGPLAARRVPDLEHLQVRHHFARHVAPHVDQGRAVVQPSHAGKTRQSFARAVAIAQQVDQVWERTGEIQRGRDFATVEGRLQRQDAALILGDALDKVRPRDRPQPQYAQRTLGEARQEESASPRDVLRSVVPRSRELPRFPPLPGEGLELLLDARRDPFLWPWYGGEGECGTAGPDGAVGRRVERLRDPVERLQGGAVAEVRNHGREFGNVERVPRAVRCRGGHGDACWKELRVLLERPGPARAQAAGT